MMRKLMPVCEIIEYTSILPFFLSCYCLWVNVHVHWDGFAFIKKKRIKGAEISLQERINSNICKNLITQMGY